VEVGGDEAVVAVEGGDEVGKIICDDAAAELAVELVCGFGGQREVVNGLDGAMEPGLSAGFPNPANPSRWRGRRTDRRNRRP